MTERPVYRESDPRHHIAHLREMLQGLVNHAREDITKITEPKFRRSSKRPPKYVLV